ncbi:cAMP-binding domain of CRP or a regulatory subunit of cAMP-dependent protein kinases [Chitinophaga sp. YR573]|uniref:Crp/Fnr family transcriptional regulator n=1 Tax=Chitinophaga sp. YR573 TaxID=1881040 RepID=UPI0008D1D5FC|nr:Crp/Fnr family transcriptional regulator [Chitinophaga sp. YR573]SEW17481.1 cAMP-binding domain of CRP or a regulatory subunit of cAMP-dependent protein kinases [Chitinophaga sp. YR573]
MFKTFETYLKEKADLTVDEMVAVRAVSIEKKIRKRQYLLQEGDVCHYNCFIVKGCLRLYRVGEDGTEHILRFGVENWWMSDRESYNTGDPSKGNIDALENSEVILIDKPDFNNLTTTIPRLNNFIEKLKARSFDASQNRIMSNISRTAEERYQEFMTFFPDIFYRVPLHMIASYLGVSRETLSRIRSQFSHK